MCRYLAFVEYSGGKLSLVGISVIALAVITVVTSIAIYQLLVQQGRLLLQLESLERNLRQQGIMTGSQSDHTRGLPAGSVLNDFELPSLSGGTMRLSQWRGRKVLLIFFNPVCEFSRAMLSGLNAITSAAHADAPAPLIISTGHAEENRKLIEEYGIQHPVLIQENREVADLYQAFGTPTGYLVSEQSSAGC